MLIRSFILLNVDLLTTFFDNNSSIEPYGRPEIIFAEVTGPTPGNLSSSEAGAELILIADVD